MKSFARYFLLYFLLFVIPDRVLDKITDPDPQHCPTGANSPHCYETRSEFASVHMHLYCMKTKMPCPLSTAPVLTY